jgi:hypothetical protein
LGEGEADSVGKGGTVAMHWSSSAAYGAGEASGLPFSTM